MESLEMEQYVSYPCNNAKYFLLKAVLIVCKNTKKKKRMKNTEIYTA